MGRARRQGECGQRGRLGLRGLDAKWPPALRELSYP